MPVFADTLFLVVVVAVVYVVQFIQIRTNY